MNWTKFCDEQPAKKGFYWIATRKGEVFPEYEMHIGSDGNAHGGQGCYRDFDGFWFGPLELPFKLPKLALAA